METISKTIACFALGFSLYFPAQLIGQTLLIAQDSRANAEIVVDPAADEPQQFAARELAGFLHQITGGDFSIVASPSGEKISLLVGEAAARTVDPNFSVAHLGPDSIVIKTVPHALILAGPPSRGTLYAVYTFLEDYLGCRWFTPAVSFVPHTPTIQLDPIDLTYQPPLEYRHVFWYDTFDADFAARNKINGGRNSRLDARHGGRVKYAGRHVHSFEKLIPAEKYFDSHPEWFSLINGQRTGTRSQLCLTNEDMRHEMEKNIKQWLHDDPEASIVSVSQNDWAGNCQCPNCRAIDEAEGSPSGSLLHFVNAVAADLEGEFPHLAIDTIAYQYTRKPPLHVRPRPNVIIRLCSIECSFSKPLSDERNRAFADDLIGWSNICNRLYIWDYTTNFRQYFQPHPNLRVLAPNIRFFVAHGVKGIFEQGAYNAHGTEMAALRAWLLAKLLWNPSLDENQLIDEFLTGYYGPAAPEIAAYIKIMHDGVEAGGDYLGCLPSYKSDPPKFLSFANLSESWYHLRLAEGKVTDNPDLLNRVRLAQLPVLYAFLRQWQPLRRQADEAGETWPLPEGFNTVYGRFMLIAWQNNITKLNEWNEGFGLLEETRQKFQESSP